MSSPYDSGSQPGGYGSYQPFPGGGQQYPGYGGGQRGYLQGGPVGFGDAVRNQMSNVLTFQGRASRSAYWWYALALVIAFIVLEILTAIVGSTGFTLLVMLIMIVISLSSLSLSVRRLHDSDKTGWLLLLGFIPFIGGLAVLILTLLPGTPGSNRFG